METGGKGGWISGPIDADYGSGSNGDDAEDDASGAVGNKMYAHYDGTKGEDGLLRGETDLSTLEYKPSFTETIPPRVMMDLGPA